MNYFVYVIRSLKVGRFYVGQTTNVPERLKEHNRGIVRSTKSRRPWQVIHTEEFHTRREAIKREYFLKSPSGWQDLKSIKERGRGFPEGITS